MADKVTILVDVHERRSGIPGLLEQLGADVELLSLPAGDYALGDDTLVERKAVLDLHSAVRRGHLWAQLAKLRAGARTRTCSWRVATWTAVGAACTRTRSAAPVSP